MICEKTLKIGNYTVSQKCHYLSCSAKLSVFFPLNHSGPIKCYYSISGWPPSVGDPTPLFTARAMLALQALY